MRNRHNHKEVKKRVLMLLEKIPATRESYDILYLEYIKSINPLAVNQPFCVTMLDRSYPSFQSVARASRAIKQEREDLRETAENAKARKAIEDSYFEEYAR